MYSKLNFRMTVVNFEASLQNQFVEVEAVGAFWIGTCVRWSCSLTVTSRPDTSFPSQLE